jgi:hypothetical protein
MVDVLWWRLWIIHLLSCGRWLELNMRCQPVWMVYAESGGRCRLLPGDQNIQVGHATQFTMETESDSAIPFLGPTENLSYSHLRTETAPISEMLWFLHLVLRMMDKAQKPSDSEWNKLVTDRLNKPLWRGWSTVIKRQYNCGIPSLVESYHREEPWILKRCVLRNVGSNYSHMEQSSGRYLSLLLPWEHPRRQCSSTLHALITLNSTWAQLIKHYAMKKYGAMDV